MIRKSEAEKREVIHIVERSALNVKKTLDELQVPRSTFYRWYKRYLEEGEAGLINQPSGSRYRPNADRIDRSWNHANADQGSVGFKGDVHP